MDFGEKLLQLRKENGLTQEDLAEKLNTTRQAISKWENNQGYPETEKLLMIGDIFKVSMDYLLKDTPKLHKEDEDGYYVSREMGNGFIYNQKRLATYISLGFAFIVLAFFPYMTFSDDSFMPIFASILLATLGIGLCSSAAFIEEDQYKVLKREPLLFDEKYVKELSVRYEQMKKKQGFFLIMGVCLLVGGFLAFALDQNHLAEKGVLEPYYPMFIIFISVGVYFLLRTAIVLDSYKLLARNEDYVNRITFKIRRKIRERIDEF